MDLHKKWHWRQRKLECRVRPETGNPSGDDLRDRLAALAGVNLQDILSEMKREKTEKETINKGVFIDYEADKKQKEVLRRSHVVGASKYALNALHTAEVAEAGNKSRKNINKVYSIQPKSPPRRVLMDVLRERAKPLIIPNKDENREKTAKLEKKLAKQRAARMAAMTDKNQADELMTNKVSTGADVERMLETVANIFPEYHGDKFSTGGDYMKGMLYLSRMLDDEAKRKQLTGTGKVGEPAQATTEAEEQAKKDADVASKAKKGEAGGVGDTMAETSRTSTEDMKAKLFCAAAICNWARNPANAGRLAEEGAVRAINKLSIETDGRTLMFVAAAYRLMAELPTLAPVMVDEGCVAAIGDLITVIASPFPGLEEHVEFMTTNLICATVALSRTSGKEATMVDDSLVASIMNLIQMRPAQAPACVRAVYNLTCVDHPYNQFERVVRAVISMSTQKSSSIKHICAAAICNFADLKGVRGRMIDEGVVSTLGNLARGSETRTRRVCAVILQNLSASKGVRLEMTSRHCVQVAYALSSDNDPIILRCIGLTMARLALEPGNAAKIITDGGIMALCNITVKFPTIPGISQPASAAFQLLAAHPAHRQTIVHEGSVTAIVTLLKMSSDAVTMRQTLLALCLLNSEPENHMAILQQGVINILQTLCNSTDDVILDLCSLAYLNMSMSNESHRSIISGGAMSSIIALATATHSVSTQRRCAVTMCNLCDYDLGLHRMVSDGIIAALVQLLGVDDEATVQYTVAAISRISCMEEHAELVTASGAVELMVEKSQSDNTTTKQLCASALSYLTLYPSCRSQLCENGVITALKELSQMADDATKHRCLVAFGNLSCEHSVQGVLVEQGLVQIISDLANSYHETSQACCASALCNLSCHAASRMRVVTDGGVQALMMISLVRSFDLNTKRLCVAALNNLLDDVTLLPLVEEGVVGAIANLCRIPDPKSPDPEVVAYCSKLFSRISAKDEGKVKIAERQTTMVALFNMIESPDVKTQICIGHTTCNLLMYAPVAATAVDAGAIRVLDQALSSNDVDMSLHAARAAFVTVCMEAKYRVLVARSTVPMTLLRMASTYTDERRSMCLKALSILAWYSDSRVFLQTADVMKATLELLLRDDLSADQDATSWAAAASTMCYLVVGYPFPPELCGMGLVEVLRKMAICITTVTGSGEAAAVSRCMASCARLLLENESCLAEFCVDDIADILLVPLAEDRSAHTAYNTAGAVYGLVSDSVGVTCFASAAGNEVLALLTADKKVVELMAAILCILAANPRSRPNVAVLSTCNHIKFCLKEALDDDTKYNVMSALYHLSKIEEMRDFLVDNDMEADVLAVLAEQPRDATTDVKVNSTRALKSIQSEGGGAIEEGTVASLIAISLEGKAKDVVSDDLKTDAGLLRKHDERPLGPPSCVVEMGLVQSSTQEWQAAKDIAPASPSGRGPGNPDAPAISDDIAFADPSLCVCEDSLEMSDAAPEGKPNMAFAKMGLPSDMKNLCTLEDEDFDNLKKSLEEPNAADTALLLEEGGADATLQLEDVSAVPFAAVDIPSAQDRGPQQQSAPEQDTDSAYAEEFEDEGAEVEVMEPKKKRGSPSKKVAMPEEEEPMDMAAETAKLGLYN